MRGDIKTKQNMLPWVWRLEMIYKLMPGSSERGEMGHSHMTHRSKCCT